MTQDSMKQDNIKQDNLKQDSIKQERFMDALDRLDDDLLMEAEQARAGAQGAKTSGHKKDGRSGRRRVKYLGLAACLCIAVIGGSLASGGETIEKYQDGNPWDPDIELKTLPAFKNNPHYGSGAPADGMTEEEMEEWLYHAADVMGVEMEQVERYVDTTTWEGHPDEEEYAGYDGLYALYARGGGLDISVDRNGILSISETYLSEDQEQKGIIRFPEEFSGPGEDLTDQQGLTLGRWLTEKYAGLLNFDDPQEITYVTTNLLGEGERHYAAYDKGDTYEESILNFNFQRARFSSTTDGWLTHISIYDRLPQLEKIGDYPLISVDEALEKLMDGEYMQPVGSSFDFDRNDVEMVSLEYMDVPVEYLIPFYIFYVDHEYEGMKEGVKNYVALLVPAIDAEGLSNYVMENWVDSVK